MLFNSLAFAKFLIAAIFIYYALPSSYRKPALLFFSYVFYGLWSVPYLSLLVAMTIVTYAAGLVIQSAKALSQKKRALLTSLAILLVTLIFFKYTGVLKAIAQMAGFSDGNAYTFERIIVPLGISYYTFKLISYAVDVYWEKIPAERDFVAFALYPAFFPQILSGPIQRADSFLSQVKRPIGNDPNLIVSGLRLMLFGYFKKIVVADSLAVIVNQVYADPLNYNSACVVLACYAFVFQLYADFSGFTDIAIGVGRLFGINSPINFNMPFYAANLQEFWRRWHITLTKWLADYVFMPLRMSLRRLGCVGMAIAITVNFIAIGLWHAATWPFFAFGLLHAIFMCVSVFILPKRNLFFEEHPRLIPWRGIWAPIITFQLWTISEVFFRASSLTNAGDVFQSILAADFSKPWVVMGRGMPLWTTVLAVIVMEIVHWMYSKERAIKFFHTRPIALRWAAYYALLIMILLCQEHGSQEFIYFKF